MDDCQVRRGIALMVSVREDPVVQWGSNRSTLLPEFLF